MRESPEHSKWTTRNRREQGRDRPVEHRPADWNDEGTAEEPRRNHGGRKTQSMSERRATRKLSWAPAKAAGQEGSCVSRHRHSPSRGVGGRATNRSGTRHGQHTEADESRSSGRRAACRKAGEGDRRWHAREDSCGRRLGAFLATDSGQREKRGAARPKLHAQDASQQRKTVRGPT